MRIAVLLALVISIALGPTSAQQSSGQSSGQQLMDALDAAAARLFIGDWVGPSQIQEDSLSNTSRATRSATQASSRSTTAQSGECSALSSKVWAEIESALNQGSYTVQTGKLDFGFFGQAGEADACGGQNCAFTNPSSPYGLVVMPLSATEDPEAKKAASTTPVFVRTDMASRTPADTKNNASANVDSASKSGDAQDIPGASSAWQLNPNEVAIVAGCLPPAAASRYFAWTHYLHALYDDQVRKTWVNVFGALGDSIGTYQLPFEDGSLPEKGIRLRLNSSLPSINKINPPPIGILALTKALAQQQAAGRLIGQGLGIWLAGRSEAEAQRNVSEAGQSPYGQFSVVMFTASQTAAQRLRLLLEPRLAALGLEGIINVLPIGLPFSNGMGLSPDSPYFMLIARNILGQGQKDAFVQYVKGSPWKAWRITPHAPRGPVANLPWNKDKGYSYSTVIPRQPPYDVNQTEAWLSPAYNWMLQALEDKLISGGMAVSWSIGSGSALQSVGIDWGLQCYNRRIDFCNGDNRDAQYLMSLPPVALEHNSKVLLLVGVNHVASGMAAYVNAAPSDPIQRLGLESFDDQEMRGTADDLMAAGPYKNLSSLFYVVALARDCKGVPYKCKVVPSSGPRSLPLTRSMLVLLRGYVNPITGVGPDADALLKFRSVTYIPRLQTLPRNNVKLKDIPVAFSNTPCTIALTSLVASCPSVFAPQLSGGSGIKLGAGLGSGIQAVRDSPLAQEVGRLPAASDCCNNTKVWATNQCWCAASSNSLIDALLPVGGRSLVAGLSRLCGNPAWASLLDETNC